MRGDIRSEWDETKQHDVLFLLTIRPPDQAELALLQQDGAELHPAEKFGLAYVRGCEVLEVKDEGACPSPPCCLHTPFLPTPLFDNTQSAVCKCSASKQPLFGACTHSAACKCLCWCCSRVQESLSVSGAQCSKDHSV